MAAQSAVAAIRQGCKFLSEGRAQIEGFKKDVEKGVGDAKALYREVTGLWVWFKRLFGGESAKAEDRGSMEIAKVAKKAKSPSELTYEEHQALAIHQICEQLKTFFQIKQQLAEHCKQLEEESKTTDNIEASALDRIQVEMQMEAMTVQIREAMIYTPSDIGLQAIYSRFLEMYNQILEEREFDRQLKRKQEVDRKWQQEQKRQIRLAKTGYAVVMALVILEMTGLFLALCASSGCGLRFSP